MRKTYNSKKQIKFRASILIIVIVFTSVFIILGNVAVQYLVNQSKQTNLKIDKEMAFQISEAGINYYRWHLSHVPGDYQDGTGKSGPYIHDYRDSQANIIGQYKLEITPPDVGSTIVIIKSTGYLIKKPEVNKTITLKLGIPSFTQYAVLSNSDIRLGPTTDISGLIHSNGGVRFDGIAHNLVTSSKGEYDDPDHELGNPDKGVHTHCNYPIKGLEEDCEDREEKDVFLGDKEFPVAPVDFGGLTGNLAEIKLKASSENGIFLTHSGRQGYHVVFNPDNKKVSIYKVNSQKICKYRKTDYFQNYENMYSIDREEEFKYKENSSLDMDIPENGLIFIEDNVWVDGGIDGSRVTVVAAEEPFSIGEANIIVNNDLLYKNKDGNNTIGLIAQNDVLIGFYSEGGFEGKTEDEKELEIDAALIAANGRVRRYYYEEAAAYEPAECGDYIFRDNLTIYGTLATNQRFGFAYTDGVEIISGYKERKIDFDSNLHLSPPPSFPTVGDYEIVSWEVN